MVAVESSLIATLLSAAVGGALAIAATATTLAAATRLTRLVIIAADVCELFFAYCKVNGAYSGRYLVPLLLACVGRALYSRLYQPF